MTTDAPVQTHCSVPAAAPFDDLAAGYDAAFTNTLIGRIMRDAVWRRLEARFGEGDRILEIGCGTGEDAVFMARRDVKVVATDASSTMVAVAEQKANACGVADLITAQVVAMEDIGLLETLPFDGVLSNFGAMNCAGDLRQTAGSLSKLVRPGGAVVLCLMGPIVPWEWAWYLLHGKPRKAFRRMRPDGVVWRGTKVRYPSIGRMRRHFEPWFRLERVGAIGALFPPPYAEVWATRHPQLFNRLNTWERRHETRWPLPWLADHYLAEFVRTEA